MDTLHLGKFQGYDKLSDLTGRYVGGRSHIHARPRCHCRSMAADELVLA